MKRLLSWIWQLPQEILGVIVYNYYKGYDICTKETCGKGVKCKLSTKMKGGITLGDYIVISNTSQLKHELGHVKQSRMLGPLYLFVVGIPSILHAAFHNCKDYYHFYTEKWANKLSDNEVERPINKG